MKRIELVSHRAAVMALLMSTFLAPAVWAQKATEKMAEDRAGFRASVLEIRKQIDTTLSALNGIVGEKEPKARKSALKKYGSEVQAMEKEIDKTKGYAEKMRERGKDFFKDWEKSTKSVKNEELKASANERRTTFKAQYDKVESGIQQARDISPTFWKNLQDLQKYFANDMSDSAVTTASELVSKTNADGKKIQGIIDEVVAAVDKVGAQAEKPAAETAPKDEAKPEEPAKDGEPAGEAAPEATPKPPAEDKNN